MGTWLWANPAWAFPGQALRLGGISPQGPASRSATALHHNPAMLAAMRGAAFQVSLGASLEQQWIRRTPIDGSTGTAQPGTLTPSSLLQPGATYFLGASFYFDPVAIGVGFYDLGSQYRSASTAALRYHMAPTPGGRCLRIDRSKCPPLGGSLDHRHDLSFALAYDGGPFFVGAAVHLPVVSQRFAFDNDTALGAQGNVGGQCASKEDPRCAERVGFRGSTRWIPAAGVPSGFDAALTFGLAMEVGRELTLGVRYRTFPLRRRGQVVLGGTAMVCAPDPSNADTVGGLPSCDEATPIRASMTQHLPQEVALGASMVVGRRRGLAIDLNLYWMDLCPGGPWGARCPTQGSQTISLVGLDRRAFVLPTFSRYRGLQDLYGIDGYFAYKASAATSVLLAGHLSSPPTAKGATTAALSDGVRLGISAGARIRLGHRSRTSVLLVPGYGLDVSLPRTVKPSDARFAPADAASFVAAGGDLNAPGADAVLEGRARATNAGRYVGLVHTLNLAIAWGDAVGD